MESLDKRVRKAGLFNVLLCNSGFLQLELSE